MQAAGYLASIFSFNGIFFRSTYDVFEWREGGGWKYPCTHTLGVIDIAVEFTQLRLSLQET